MASLSCEMVLILSVSMIKALSSPTTKQPNMMSVCLQTRKSRVKNKGQKINFSVKYQIKTFLYILYEILYFQVGRFQFGFVLMNRLIDSYRIYIKYDDDDG